MLAYQPATGDTKHCQQTGGSSLEEVSFESGLRNNLRLGRREGVDKNTCGITCGQEKYLLDILCLEGRDQRCYAGQNRHWGQRGVVGGIPLVSRAPSAMAVMDSTSTPTLFVEIHTQHAELACPPDVSFQIRLNRENDFIVVVS